MKIMIVLFMAVLLMASASAVLWNDEQVYDEIDDSSINATLWIYDDTGPGTTTVTEDNDRIEVIISVDSSNAIGDANITSIALPSGIGNLTWRVNLTSSCGGGVTTSANTYTNVFGNTIDSVSCTQSTTNSEVHTYSLVNDDTLGANNYNVYIDGSYSTQITATNNVLSVISSMNEQFGNGVPSISQALTYYVYYSYTNSTMNITLNSPQDAVQLVGGQSTTFNASVIAEQNNLVNMTFYINGVANETKSLSGTSDSETFTKTADLSWLNWSVEVCDDGVNCKMSEVRTISVSNLIEDDVTYQSEAFEGSTQTFTSNITWDATSFPNIDARIHYNGTNYLASKTIDGDEAYFSVNLNVPLVPSDTNITFYWNYSLFGASTVYVAGTSYNQTVKNFNIDDCSVYSEHLLNYTMYDETTQIPLNGTTLNGTIEIDLDIFSSATSTSPVIEFSKKYSNVNNALVCLESALGSETYLMDVQVRYYANDYQTEQNHIQAHSLSTSTMYQNITLYALNTSLATIFDITYKDSSFLPVEGAIIDIARQYIAEGKYKTVEKPKTDANGRTTASLVKDTQAYTFYVYKDGTLLSTFNNVYPICDDELTGDCAINLNAFSSVQSPGDFINEDNMRYTLTYDESTRTINFDFTIVDGSTSTLTLNVTVLDQFLDTYICSEQLSSSSGSLNCVIPASYVNQTAQVFLYKDGELLVNPSISLVPDASDFFGDNAWVLALIMVLIVPFMFITSLMGMVIGAVLGVVISVLMLISTGAGALQITTSLAFLFLSAGALLWQLNNRQKGGL